MDNLELRVRELESQLAAYKKAISVQSGRIILQHPVIIRGTASINGITIFTGTGSPENVVTANIGSLYLRFNGSSQTTLYIKEANTNAAGWRRANTTAA